MDAFMVAAGEARALHEVERTVLADAYVERLVKNMEIFDKAPTTVLGCISVRPMLLHVIKGYFVSMVFMIVGLPGESKIQAQSSLESSLPK